MTDTDRPSLLSRLGAAFASITLPQALVVIAMIAGAVTALVLLPEAKLEWVKGLIIAVVTLGTGGTLFLPSHGSRSSDSSSSPPPPTRLPRRPTDGSFGALDLVLIAIILVGALVIVPLLSGCGGALQAQARALTVATVALEGVDRAVEAHARARLAECDDEACVDATELELTRALEPVTVAMAATRGVLSTSIEALHVALVAGEDGDVLRALATSAGRLVVEWGVLAAALGTAGIEVPAIPPLVLAAGGAL